MRKAMIAGVAAAALSVGAVTTAVAAPHGGGGGGGHFGGGGGHFGGGGGHFGGGHFGGGHFGGFGGVAHGPIGGAGAGNFAALRGNPAYVGRSGTYAWRGDHGFYDHGRGRRRVFFGPAYGGLYAYDGNWPYCNNGWPYYYNYNYCYGPDWND